MYEWQTLSSKWIKTRSKRQCDGCGRTWPKGAPMFWWVGVFDVANGKKLITCVCVVCKAFMDHRRGLGYPDFPPPQPFWELDDEEYVDIEAHALAVLVKYGVPRIQQYSPELVSEPVA